MTDNGTEYLAPIIPSTPLWTTYYLIRPAKKRKSRPTKFQGEGEGEGGGEIVKRYDLSMTKPQACN
jgi:hypothetical protein